MEPDRQDGTVQPATAPKEESVGFMTMAILGLIILGFVGWIVWLVAFGGDGSGEPKRLSDEQMRMTVDQASQDDPELKAMLVLKRAPQKTPPKQAPVKLDINTATEAQLGKVPGLSEWDVNAIIKRRPYKSLDELRSRNVIGETRYNDSLEFLRVAEPAN